jgi:Spy/CpxP family protein refolding chaperone
MNHKIIVITLCLFLFSTGSSLAKEDQLMAKIILALDLNDKQVTQVKAIIQNYLVQEEQLKVEETKALSKVLTANQMYAWQDLQKQPEKEKKKHVKHNSSP